jgi:hypothetical protein
MPPGAQEGYVRAHRQVRGQIQGRLSTPMASRVPRLQCHGLCRLRHKAGQNHHIGPLRALNRSLVRREHSLKRSRDMPQDEPQPVHGSSQACRTGQDIGPGEICPTFASQPMSNNQKLAVLVGLGLVTQVQIAKACRVSKALVSMVMAGKRDGNALWFTLERNLGRLVEQRQRPIFETKS